MRARRVGASAFGFCFMKLRWVGRGYFLFVVAIGYVTLTQHGRPVALDIALFGSLAVGLAACFMRSRLQTATAA